MLPLASVTVHVTTVVPNGKVLGASLVTDSTEQLSAVIGVPNATFKASQSLFVEAATAEGAVIVGLMLSVTVTV